MKGTPFIEVDDDTQAVMNAFGKVVHALEVGSRASQKRIGLKGAQLSLLQILASKKAMSVSELASRSPTHHISISVVVRSLVDAKLVNRSTPSSDRQSLDLTVTAAGRRLLKSSALTPQQRMIASLKELPPARLSELRFLLEEVVIQSGFDSDTPPLFFEKGAGSSSKTKKKKRGMMSIDDHS